MFAETEKLEVYLTRERDLSLLDEFYCSRSGDSECARNPSR